MVIHDNQRTRKALSTITDPESGRDLVSFRRDQRSES